MRSPESGHLAIPARGEILAEAVERCELTQRMKVFGKTRVCVIDFRLLYELAPRLVREERERTKFAAIFEMAQDFACRVFLILERGIAKDLRAKFDKRFLRVCSFAMNAANKADQLVPRLAVYVAILSCVNRSPLPFGPAVRTLDRFRQPDTVSL